MSSVSLTELFPSLKKYTVNLHGCGVHEVKDIYQANRLYNV